VFGLGNPGRRYEATRHNFGIRVIDALAVSQRASLLEGPGPFRACTFTQGSEAGLLAVPLTFMNRAGVAAEALLERFDGIALSRFLVVSDDLDLPLGRIRFRRAGGNGGHNGIRSLIESLGSEEFPRLRLGIGRPPEESEVDVIDWVLEPFAASELGEVRQVCERGVEGVRTFVTEGIEAAMNRFNSG
jgi:PTH1 family peptidyl-tRNA hydrolase